MKNLMIKPVVTEKSMKLAGEKQYQFFVPSRASKSEIARAIEEIFGVVISHITTANYSGRSVRFRQKSGQTHRVKKVTVRLGVNQTIADFALPTEKESPSKSEKISPKPAEKGVVASGTKVTVRSRSKKEAA